MAVVGWRLALRLVAVGVLAAVAASGCGNRSEESESAVSGPPAGATLAVVGIQYDATLPVRSAPGADQPVVASLGPLEDHVVATGQARQVGSSRWFEVTAAGATGWADSTSLAYLGATDDVTRRIVDKLGGPPTAESMLELGRVVAAAESSAENPKSRVTVTVAPTTVGDLGEVTYDVVGFPDDAIAGERLHILGTPGDRFTLEKVEATSLCRRGVSGDSPRYACDYGAGLMTAPLPQPGWYPDPEDASRTRYWGGATWMQQATSTSTGNAKAKGSGLTFRGELF